MKVLKNQGYWIGVTMSGIFGGLGLFFLWQPIVVPSSEIPSTDAMVVLGGGRGYRVEGAVAQYAQYQLSTIFLTGGGMFYGKADAHHMRDYAMSMGVPADIMHALDQSQSTMDDAVHLRRYVTNHGMGIQRLLIVTSRFHTGRSKWVFDRVFEGSGIELYVLGVDDGVDYNAWWTDRDMAEIVLLEKARFLLYRLVGLLKPSILKP